MARPRVTIRCCNNGGSGITLDPNKFLARDSTEPAASEHDVSDLALDLLAESTAAGMRGQIGAAAVPVIATPSSSSGALVLDFAGRHAAVFAVTLTEDVTTVTLSNLPASGFVEYEAHFTQDATGGWEVDLPASHKALGGSVADVADGIGAVTVLAASTVDGGTTWRYAMQESA